MRAAARGGAANLVGAAITSVLSLVLVIVVTHGLGRGAAGAVFIVTSLYIVVETVVRLGTDIGVVHFVAGRRARDNGGVTDVIWASFIPLIPAMLLGGLVVGLVTPVVVDALAGHGDLDHVVPMAWVLALAVPVGATYDFMTAATRGLGSTRPTVLVERILRPVLQTICVALAVVVGANGSVVVIAVGCPVFHHRADHGVVLARADAGWAVRVALQALAGGLR